MNYTDIKKYEKYSRNILWWISISIWTTAISIMGQTPVECPLEGVKNSSPKYKIGRTERTISGPDALLVYVSVNSKYLNERDMGIIALSLDNRFCFEERISGMFFDEHRSTKTFEFHPHAKHFTRDMAAWRGNLVLDRRTGDGYISFSARRGGSREEIKVKVVPRKTASKQGDQ